MKCQTCGKKEALHQYTEIIGDKKSLIHVCDDCAKKSGASESSAIKAEPLKSSPKAKLEAENPLIAISDIFSFDKALKKCDRCGWTYETFRKKGRLGCARCYFAFSLYLESIFAEIQGGPEHVGKRPLAHDHSRLSRTLAHQRELETLNRKLEAAVKTEAFEQAAELRDMIYDLTEQFKKNNPELS